MSWWEKNIDVIGDQWGVEGSTYDAKVKLSHFG